ncbi:MAG: CreA family protein [Magnetovibrio sp.]|nr:CreA family protein [Magnetovibrio sp.]
MLCHHHRNWWPKLGKPDGQLHSLSPNGDIIRHLIPATDVFRQSKNILFFKTMHVDRFYDKARNVLVYISYTSKLTGKNASHSISVVPLSFPLAKNP